MSDASRYQGSRPDSNFGYGLQGGSKESRDLPHEQDPRAAREDASLPRTLEGLEQKFLDEIMKLNKELQDAEDAELSRHREVRNICAVIRILIVTIPDLTPEEFFLLLNNCDFDPCFNPMIFFSFIIER